ncbi:CPBP family intramembrane glutamic endopeptidase [Actinoplanes sp. NPDC024001]|uniref:CPBP family intramembrane glutamic endopeptidase n=1 Tax=Actinoplanes sp. NPDC024001 TaxID=3154598 RepID=UPI0033D4F981
MTVALVLLVMAAVRVWNHRGPRWAQPVTGPPAAALLVALSGLTPAEAGVVLSGLGYALSGVTVIAAGYGLALLIPPARRALAAAEYPRPVFTALVAVPLATVTFEEVAFRGVLWTLIARDHGPLWATAVTAVVFGLWHWGTPGAVAFTTLAGVALGGLRHIGGGVLAPYAVHWAANGLGVLASALVSRPRPPS